MYSIGALSRETGVKIPTIRYYEQIGLLVPPERTEGNQRRYTGPALERLGLIKNARELGFSIEAIRNLIELSGHPKEPCSEASRIAREQLVCVRERIKKLKALEAELDRLSTDCDNTAIRKCAVLKGLSNQRRSKKDHSSPVESDR